MKKQSQLVGIIATLTAGILWGFSGACGQYIFINFNTNPAQLTAIRLLVSGIILTAIGFLSQPKPMLEIIKTKESFITLIMFSVFGLSFCQLSFLEAIAHSNAATATILQYIGPVLVMIVSCFFAKRLPESLEIVAIALALFGTFLIATRGNIHSMVITPAGLFWGLTAAVSVMMYTLIPVKLLKNFGSTAPTGYGMLIGGIIMTLFTRAWEIKIIPTLEFFLSFAAIVILGSVLTFTLYLKGVEICGPVKASMLASIEPVAAAIFMVVWLKGSITKIELVGFLCIFLTIFLLSKEGKDSKN